MSATLIPLSARSQRTLAPPISWFIRLAVENPDLISLAAGLVDADSLPGPEVADACAELLRDPSSARAALQYGTTHGYAPLREKLLARTVAFDHLAPRDLHLSADDVVVTTGSQQLLYLVAEALLDPGDIVIAERPSYFVFQGTLDGLGVRTLTVPLDGDGLCPDALEDLLDRLDSSGDLARLKLIYTVDYFQNPTGLTLARERRERIVELARQYSRKHRILILEDAAYRELRYEGNDLPSLKSFDPTNEHVILAMTFSKPCAPGLKTGYGFLPRELIGPVLHLKGNHDFGSNNLTQHLVDRLLETGAYDRHAAELCRVYRRKRDALLAALAEAFRSWPKVRWTHPEGGPVRLADLSSGRGHGARQPLDESRLARGGAVRSRAVLLRRGKRRGADVWPRGPAELWLRPRTANRRGGPPPGPSGPRPCSKPGVTRRAKLLSSRRV